MINPILMIGMPGPTELFLILLCGPLFFIAIVVIVVLAFSARRKKEASVNTQSVSSANLDVAQATSLEETPSGESIGAIAPSETQRNPTGDSLRSS